MPKDSKKEKRQERSRDLKYYPIALNLKNKLVVIAGGGHVALMKTRSLLKSKAKVRIISPELLPELKKCHKAGQIEWVPRKIRSSDINGALIAIAATSDENTNQNVSKWAKQKKIPVNVVDQPDLSDFISPAVSRKKEAIIAVYTNGICPSLSRDIKNFLNDRWNEFISYRKSKKQ